MLLIACGIWELYTTSVYPLFPRDLFANLRGFTVAVGVTFLVGMLYYSTGILWPIQVQVLYSSILIDIGWYAIALGICGAISAPIGGWAMKKYGHARWMFTGFVLILTLVSGLQATVSK